MLLRGCWWFIKGCIPGRSGLRSGAFLVVECRGPWSAVGLVLVVSTVVRASLLEGERSCGPWVALGHHTFALEVNINAGQ